MLCLKCEIYFAAFFEVNVIMLLRFVRYAVIQCYLLLCCSVWISAKWFRLLVKTSSKAEILLMGKKIKNHAYNSIGSLLYFLFIFIYFYCCCCSSLSFVFLFREYVWRITKSQQSSEPVTSFSTCICIYLFPWEFIYFTIIFLLCVIWEISLCWDFG